MLDGYALALNTERENLSTNPLYHKRLSLSIEQNVKFEGERIVTIKDCLIANYLEEKCANYLQKNVCGGVDFRLP